MGPQAPLEDPQALDIEQVPELDVLLTDVIARLSLAAHAYLGVEEGGEADWRSAEAVIDVASLAFERVKERLRPQERLAITQLLTETRMAFVRRRGL